MMYRFFYQFNIRLKRKNGQENGQELQLKPGEKRHIFSVKLLVNYTFVHYLHWGVVQKPLFFGKGGVGFV